MAETQLALKFLDPTLLICFLVAWFVVAVFGYFSWKVFSLRFRGVRTEGICVAHAFGNYGVSVVAEYSGPDGQVYEAFGLARAIPAAPIGGSVPVVFDPKRPKNAEVLPAQRGIGYMLMGVALIGLVAGIAITLQMLK